MTAREFLSYAGWEGDLEKGLAILGRYVGKGSDYYISFPSAELPAEFTESIVYKFMSKETLHDGRCPKCGGIVEWGWWDPFAEEWDDPFRYGETPPQRSSIGRCPSCNIIFEFQI